MDEKERLSEPYQRVFQYLYRYHHKIAVDEFTYCSTHAEGDETDCIKLLLQWVISVYLGSVPASL